MPTDEYKVGVIAGFFLIDCHDTPTCPYSSETSQYRDWFDGFMDGFKYRLWTLR